MRDDPMITLAEAGIRLRMPYQDVHRLMLLGSLQSEKRGGRWFVRRADVEREARERQAARSSTAAPAA
jgi:hypothetical protein